MSAHHSPSEGLARMGGPRYCMGCGGDWPCGGYWIEERRSRPRADAGRTIEALEHLVAVAGELACEVENPSHASHRTALLEWWREKNEQAISVLTGKDR